MIIPGRVIVRNQKVVLVEKHEMRKDGEIFAKIRFYRRGCMTVLSTNWSGNGETGLCQRKDITDEMVVGLPEEFVASVRSVWELKSPIHSDLVRFFPGYQIEFKLG